MRKGLTITMLLAGMVLLAGCDPVALNETREEITPEPTIVERTVIQYSDDSNVYEVQEEQEYLATPSPEPQIQVMEYRQEIQPIESKPMSPPPDPAKYKTEMTTPVATPETKLPNQQPGDRVPDLTKTPDHCLPSCQGAAIARGEVPSVTPTPEMVATRDAYLAAKQAQIDARSAAHKAHDESRGVYGG